MESRRQGWKGKLLLLVASTGVVLLFVGIGEVYCRYFTRINFLDNSRGLFKAGRYGNTYGNTPNFEGVSFGEKFRTDENGFRIEPGFVGYRGTENDSVLILGDSVAFGPALADDKTVAGRLRRALTEQRVINGSAIGYDTFDYLNAGRAITAAKPEVRTVLLFFCLNDVSDASAQAIRSQTAQNVSDEEPQGRTSVPYVVNDFLRSRSKLYLWLKNALIDTQMVYFRNDLANYQRGPENVSAALQPIAELREDLESKGVALKVFIMPYEAQLRPDAAQDHMDPQRLVSGYFRQAGIEHYDVTPAFRHSGVEPKHLYLYGDPMHLSEEGTLHASRAVCEGLPGCRIDLIPEK